MIDFFKKLYALPFVLGAWGWLAFSGIFAYLYFLAAGFKEEQVRSFLYFQGKVIQLAILGASAFRKKLIRNGQILKPSILAANHPCAYDTFLFFDFGIKNLVCIAKGWPFKIPIYGSLIEKAGYINSDNKTAAEIVNLAREKLKQGLHIGIFPEGTRSSKIGRFRSLAFEISLKTGADIVPFAIKGLDKMLAPKAFFAKLAAVSYIQLAPVSPEEFYGKEAGALRMAQYVKSLIVEKL
ncbi:MAG: 1-acyl-sn-glycerol-3-phosphate acyltransferase [Elusimicrobiota bacterium]|jgi:1-acyl-sn-glycerol-3-phosphate acyltransferase|nr:1-acyl-sn-glycerol-3-phosphate acyltransferase [Elusimicrobiota bacterium]